MNFSSSVMTGMGISLGGLEIATDFLYANSDMYEPELTEVKATISHKVCRPVTRVKPVRPKTSTQNILNKFTLIPANKRNKTIDNSCDEIIDDTVGIVEQSDDFDFSFDDIKEEKSKECAEQQKETEALANDLLNRIQNNDSVLENNMDNEEDDFNLDDIEDEDDFGLEDISLGNEDDENDEEDNGSFNIDTIENLDEESDEDDIEFDLEDDENEEDTEEDDIEFDVEDDIEFDVEDDIEFDIDEEDDTEEIPKQTVQKVEPKQEIKVETKPKEIDLENDEEDEDDIEFDLGDEIDLDEIELPTQNEKLKQINNIEKQSSIKDTQPKIESITKENQMEQKPSAKELQMMEQIKQLEAQVQRLSANNAPKQESEHELMSHIRQLEAQIQNLSIVNTCEPASNVESKSIKKDSSFKVPNNKPVKTVEEHNDNTATNYDMYSAMQIDALYKEVRKFAIELGVKQKPVEISKLEEKFGAMNIRKLVNKSYIIKIGKGATIGR